TRISDRTRCVTALPRTCSSRAWIFASSRCCSDTRPSDPPRSIPILLIRCGPNSANFCPRPPTASSREGGPAMANSRVCLPKADLVLADVVRRFGLQYVSQYGQGMMPSQKRALSDIAACCTRELGGRLHCCEDCDDTFWRYHCCRNRACRKC